MSVTYRACAISIYSEVSRSFALFVGRQIATTVWYFLHLQFGDFKQYAVQGALVDNPRLERSIALFNGLSQWIQCMVLSKTTPTQRAQIIVKFINVAKVSSSNMITASGCHGHRDGGGFCVGWCIVFATAQLSSRVLS